MMPSDQNTVMFPATGAGHLDPADLSVYAMQLVSGDQAAAIAGHLSHCPDCRAELAPYKRIRRIEFAELPKTISGKIRRVELRKAEDDRHAAKMAGTGDYAPRADAEFWEDDIPELKE